MTSFLIADHKDRTSPWAADPCPFCEIIDNSLPAFRVYENDKVIAILDIMPLRRGHTLVIPKAHFSRLSELPGDVASAVGEAVSKVAHALTKALNNTGLNVVCNQEYAQAVPHVHYHVIPAPIFGASPPEPDSDRRVPLSRREMHQKEFESRGQLDDDEADVLVRQIRAKL